MIAGAGMYNVITRITIDHAVSGACEAVNNILRGPFSSIAKNNMLQPAFKPGILDGDAIIAVLNSKN